MEQTSNTNFADELKKMLCGLMGGLVDGYEDNLHELRCEVAMLRAENIFLIDGIRGIADDFHPDRDEDAPLALSEMRNALEYLLEMIPQDESGENRA